MRIGLIGFEGHKYEILGAVKDVPGGELVAVVPGSPDEKMPTFSDSPSVTAATIRYDDPIRMLDEAKLDIVGVAPAIYLIPKFSQAAAERGIHVLSEKPLAIDLDTLAALRATADKNKVQIVAMLAMRHSGPYQAAHDAVAAGLIGEPILVSAQKSYRWGTRPEWYKDRKTYGGTIPWVAIHAIDYMRWASGLEFKSVAGFQGNLGHTDYPGCEDHGGLVFRMSNGGTGLLNFDYLRPAAAPSHGDDRLRIMGTKGSIEIRDESSRVELITHDAGPRDLPLPPTVRHLADFASSIQNGHAPIVTMDDSFRATEVCIRARDAADRGVIAEL